MVLPHDEGGSGPAVVLLHAGVADRSMWAEHLQPLAGAGHRAVALGLPGFGDVMPAPGRAGAVDRRAADHGRAVDRSRRARGQLVRRRGRAARGAGRARARVGAGADLRPAPGIEPSAELKAIWQAEEAALERGDTDAAVEAVVAGWTLPGAPPSCATGWRRCSATRSSASPTTANGSRLRTRSDEHPEALAELALPVLVAAGEHDLPDFRQGAEELARTLPGAATPSSRSRPPRAARDAGGVPRAAARLLEGGEAPALSDRRPAVVTPITLYEVCGGFRHQAPCP